MVIPSNKFCVENACLLQFLKESLVRQLDFHIEFEMLDHKISQKSSNVHSIQSSKILREGIQWRQEKVSENARDHIDWRLCKYCQKIRDPS